MRRFAMFFPFLFLAPARERCPAPDPAEAYLAPADTAAIGAWIAA